MKSVQQQHNISLAISADSDDAFMLLALEQGNVLPPPGYRFEIYRADIQQLNERALHHEFAVTAISVAVYPRIIGSYRLLEVGASVAEEGGPTIVSRIDSGITDIAQLQGQRIAFAGKDTSSYLVARDLLPSFRAVQMSFLEILPAVIDRQVDAGVLIHELQLAHGQHNVRKLAALGDLWQAKYQTPLPLGAMVISRRLAPDVQQTVSSVIRASIDYGLKHRATTLQQAMATAPAKIDRQLADLYIDRYVNKTTLCLDRRTRQAIAQMLVQYRRDKCMRKLPRRL